MRQSPRPEGDASTSHTVSSEKEVTMSEVSPPTITSIVARLRAGELDRRAFLAAAGRLGITASMASAIFAASESAALASGGGRGHALGVRTQDGGKTLIVAFPQATLQLDPANAGVSGYGDIIPITENLYEGLTRFKNGSAEIEPALAESWTASDDGLSYVFKIRSGVTFHDGTPLDAKAVETNLNRQLNESDPLHSADMVYAGIILADVTKVEATGDLELTLTLDKPITLLPGNLAVF